MGPICSVDISNIFHASSFGLFLFYFIKNNILYSIKALTKEEKTEIHN